MGRIITITRECDQPQDEKGLDLALEVLLAGGVVAIPTETFYGLAADSQNEKGLARLYKIKARSKDKPFPLIAGSQEQACRLAKDISQQALKLMQQHWPGPLTVVLSAKNKGPAVSATGGIGVRVSPCAFARKLALKLKRPITATSANISGQESVTRVQDLDPKLAQDLDLIIDSGVCPGGLASTVVDLTKDSPVLLRKGPIDII